MKAPVFLSCSHAVFAFVAFPLSPVPFPVFYLGGTAGNRLNLLCPTWAGKAPSGRLKM